MAEELGERTEMPTPRRLGQARQRGQIAKSKDLSGAVDLIGAVLLLWMMGERMAAGLAVMVREVLDGRAFTVGASLTLEGVTGMGWWAAEQGARVLLPMLVMMFAVVYLAEFAQVRWLWSKETIRLDVNRLNPLSGFGRIFSTRTAAKTAVNAVKLVLVGSIGVTAGALRLREMAGLALLTPLGSYLAMGRILIEVLVWMLAVMLVIGVADWMYQKWQHTRDLKMTKQEVKDERRSMEGDMEVKGRRLRMAREAFYQRLGQSVPRADVVVTNPTHFAVALRYDEATMAAPVVVAKGTDLVAQRIREIAAVAGVPIVQRPALARALYAEVDVGRTVRPQYYAAVAEVLAYVYKLEERAA